ncbi:MAG TPA: hypothetical protein PLV92_18955, partial [Pirellulaceae bacterium]|nr:hypothetical protein [Pirellulaceae bacterium]
VGYDAGLKRTPAGPIVMGSCRFFNVLLGMSLAASVASGIPALLWYEPSQLLVAAGIGVYIIGVTWFARSEATTSQRLPLILGLVVMAAGIACLGIFPQYAKEYGLSRIKPAFLWQIMLLALFVPIFRRGMNAVIHPSPQRVQAAVKNCILSLIMLDAAISVVVGHHQWGLVILLLLVPTLLLGRWVYST